MQGHTDVELDVDGHDQAARIAERLARSANPPQAVYSSDLQRARLTAEAIAAPLGLTVKTTPLLRETMLGDWEGLTADGIVARGDEQLLDLYKMDSYVHRPPGAETMEDVWHRMNQAVEVIRGAHPHGNVAVVGHGGSLRVLICKALGAPITTMKHIWLGNAGLSIIEEVGPEDQRMQRVMLLNDTSHLSAL